MEVNRCQQERGVDVKFASKLDFSAEALFAYPGLRPTCLHSSNKFQSKQNATLNNATSILSQFFIQPYIILRIFTV